MLHACISSVRARIALAALPLLILTASTAHAQTPSYTVTDFSVQGGGSYTLGYNFKPTQDIYVTALGQWIYNGTTIAGTETMGIYNSTGTLVFSTAYTQANATIIGNTDIGGDQFRYTDITGQFSANQRKLLANTQYTLAGTDYNGIVVADANNLTANPLINITSVGLYASGGFQRPTTTNIYNMYGMNLLFSTTSGVTPVPEPGSVGLLMGAGVTGAGLLARRRRRAEQAS